MMSPKNLTESGFYPITFFVPLFIDGEKELGIHVKLFERFGAWSFEMESDLRDCNSLIDELFTGLCRKAGLRRRIICAIDLEIGRRDDDYEFICNPYHALACGDFFTLEAIHHLLSTAFIPYWQFVARQINEYDQADGWKNTCKRAIEALGTWGKFDDAEMADGLWECSWNDVNCGHDRRQLIQGNNWRIPAEDNLLERFEEHTSKHRFHL